MSKVNIGVLFALALALALGIFIGSRRQTVVHAQTASYSTGCITGVRKDWGKYQGASLFGLAFEDDKGTVRFVAHPNCGGLGQGADSQAAASIADLTIVRQ